MRKGEAGWERLRSIYMNKHREKDREKGTSKKSRRRNRHLT
jgi:hypothetical protein